MDEIGNQKSSKCCDGSRDRLRVRVGEWSICAVCVSSWSQRGPAGARRRETGAGEIEFTPSSLGSLDEEEWKESLEYVRCGVTRHVGEVVNQFGKLFG